MVVDITSSNREYDILVMGGGIIGICTAWYARQKWPEKKIAVLEKGLIGKGATAWSACLDMPYAATPFKRRLTIRSRLLFDGLLEKIPHLPLVKTPFVGIAAATGIRQVMDHLTIDGAESGSASDFYNHAPANFVLPGDASFFSNITAGYAQPDFTYTLAIELAKKHIVIYESTEVTRVAGDDLGYTIYTNYGLILQATAVIDATGPWMLNGPSGKLLAKKNARVKKVVALHIDQPPPANAPVLYFFDDDAFVLPQPRFSRWLFSYRCDDWDIDPGKNDCSISGKNMHDALQVLHKYNSSFCNYITGGRVFCDLYSANGDPVIEAYGPNYFIAGAPGGSGFRLAPAIAEAVIEKMVEGGPIPGNK